MQVFTYVLLVGAGVALIAQNLLMAGITDRVSTVLIPLVMNSAVGLALLTGLLVSQIGLGGLREAIGTLRPWFILPGLLGTFFVYASLSGYQRIGAAATISVLVASQLIVGLGVDLARSGPASRVQAGPIAGIAFLIVGAFLVVFRRT